MPPPVTGTQSDPTDALIVDAFERKLRGAELRKRISQASATHYEFEYGHGLPARAERSAVYAFTKALENGGADTIIASLTTRFDAAAKALTECAEHIDPNMDPDTALRSSTDDRVRVAWQDIDRHVITLDKVAAVVTQFGGKSLTFGLIELPNNLGGTGRLDDRALMAVDHQKLDITRASAIFNQPGTHRRSPWFLAAAALKLNTIGEARETIRAWAEQAWDALDYNRGRGRMDGDKFVAMPIPNPYAARR